MITKVEPIIVQEIMCLEGIEILDYDWYLYTIDEPEPIEADVVDVYELYTLCGFIKPQPVQLEF
jgi:hypothetical protein